MTIQGKGTFTTSSWEEKPPEEGVEGPRISHASTTSRYDGAIVGTSAADYVMVYSGQGDGWGDGTYVGYEQVTGAVGGRKGTFVLQHVGEFEGTTVRARWAVVEGSGTAELEGLRGEGGFTASHGEEATAYTFDHGLGTG